MNIPIDGQPVKKNVLTVDLILVQIQVPALAEIVNCHENATIARGTWRGCEEIPHKARFPAVSGLCKLNLGENLVAACRLRLGEIRVEAKAKVGAINGSVLEFETVSRERLPGLRGRDVLVSQRIEAVIGAYKEILAGYGRFIVVGRLVAYNRLCEGIPGQLYRMVERPPSCQRPPVDIHKKNKRKNRRSEREDNVFPPAFFLPPSAPKPKINPLLSPNNPTREQDREKT